MVFSTELKEGGRERQTKRETERQKEATGVKAKV